MERTKEKEAGKKMRRNAGNETCRSAGKGTLCLRVAYYAAGMIILALGLTLNTKTDLGVSAIVSISFAVSEIWSLNFGDMTLLLYTILVALQLILHGLFFRRKFREAEDAGEQILQELRARRREILLKDALQIPMSLLFTRFLNLFAGVLPDVAGTMGLSGRFLALALAVFFTGLGSAMSLNMRLIPSAGDGIVQAVADYTGKSVGLMKNCVDVACVTTAAAIGLVGSGRIVGVGVGTLCSALFVGRVIAVYNHFFFAAMTARAGVRTIK